MRKQLFLLCFTLLLFIVSCQKSSIGPIIQKFLPTEGEPGDTVGIRGKNFGFSPASTEVDFNGTRAVVTYVVDTVIISVVPQGATTGKVSVTLGGHTTTSDDDFIVYPGTWIQKADLPSAARKDAAGFAINEKGYLGTGNDGSIRLDDFWQYDAATNQWTKKANVPLKIEAAISMTITNNGYIGSGKSDNGAIDDFWQYDAATDAWIAKAKFPGLKRFGAVGFGAGDKGYAGTGEFSAGNFLIDWWEYDPSADSWTKKADFPGDARARGAGFVINDKIYFGLGDGKTDWWEYDPSTNVWMRKADFPVISFDVKGFAVAGKGYVAGGQECWEYDASTDHWTRNVFFGYRLSSVAFTVGNKGYYGTGSGLQGSLQKDFWEFTPAQ